MKSAALCSTASEMSTTGSDSNAIDKQVTIPIRFEHGGLKLSISGVLTTAVLHEECVRAVQTKFPELGYTFDNTMLDLGNIERYRDVIKREGISLKRSDLARTVFNLELFTKNSR